MRRAAGGYRANMTRLESMGLLEIWYLHAYPGRLNPLIKIDPKSEAVFKKVLAKALSTENKALLPKVAERRNDGSWIFRDDPPILTRVSASTKAKVIDALNRYSDTLPRERRFMLSRYRVADVAHRVVGVGSVGTRAYLALLFGNGDNDPLFLQVKEAALPAHGPYVPQLPKEFLHNGKRVVLGQKGLQASNDPMLGYTEIDGRHYYVRQMKNLKASIPVEWLTGAHITSLHGRAGRCWRAHTHGWETQRRSPATAASQRSWIRRWRNGPRVTEIRRSRTTQFWLSPSSEGRLKHRLKR